jgi:predicted patatin/cPLA2 family phospholipase
MHPVAQVLLDRRAARSRPGARSDAHRVGLAVEGGAVRGVVSAGMLVALEELGLRDAFDVVYGSSAGSFNAAYFLTGQGWQALPLYLDQVAGRSVIDLRRMLRGAPVLCLDHVVEVLMRRDVPLDWDGLLASPIELRVVASSVAELEPVLLTGFSSPEELARALRAGATIPFVAGPPFEFRGQPMLDAAVTQAHPYESAVAEGCTHVLSLSTRPRGRIRSGPDLGSRLMAWRLDRIRRGLGRASLRRIAAYGEAQRRLVELTERPSDPPHVLDVAPAAGSAEVSRLTRDVGRILAGARQGYQAAVQAVENRSVRAMLRLTAADAESS